MVLLSQVLGNRIIVMWGTGTPVSDNAVSQDLACGAGRIEYEGLIRSGGASQLRCSGALQATDLGSLYVPIVPKSVRAPVVASMLYMETLFESEFVT